MRLLYYKEAMDKRMNDEKNEGDLGQVWCILCELPHMVIHPRQRMVEVLMKCMMVRRTMLMQLMF